MTFLVSSPGPFFVNAATAPMPQPGGRLFLDSSDPATTIPTFDAWNWPVIRETLAPFGQGIVWGELTFDVLGDCAGTPLLQVALNARAFEPGVADDHTDFLDAFVNAIPDRVQTFRLLVEAVDFTPPGVPGAGVDVSLCARKVAGKGADAQFVAGYRDCGPRGSVSIVNVSLSLDVLPMLAPLWDRPARERRRWVFT